MDGVEPADVLVQGIRDDRLERIMGLRLDVDTDDVEARPVVSDSGASSTTEEIENSHIPVYTMPLAEYKARRVAGYLANYQVQHGVPPTVAVLYSAMCDPSHRAHLSGHRQVEDALQLAVSLGLVEERKGAGRWRRYWAPRRGT